MCGNIKGSNSVEPQGVIAPHASAGSLSFAPTSESLSSVPATSESAVPSTSVSQTSASDGLLASDSASVIPAKVRFSETAEVFVRDGAVRRVVPITDAERPAIPSETLRSWRESLALLAETAGVAYARVVRIERDGLRVILACRDTSATQDVSGFCCEGELVPLGTGLFCETVLGTDAELVIEDVEDSPVWSDGAEARLGARSYLGIPLHWGDGSLFGTLCIIGMQQNGISDYSRRLLRGFGSSMERDLELICLQSDHAAHGSEMDSMGEALLEMFRFAPGGIFSYSAEADEQFSLISTNMLSFLGYTREEFVEKYQNRFSLMVWYEDRARVLAEIDEQISHGSFDTCEYRIEKKDGTIVWVHDEGHIVTDENGKRWFFVVIVDITDAMDDRRRLILRNQELEDAIRYQQETLDRIPGGIRVFKKIPDGIICVNANRYYAQMMGVDERDLIGESFDHSEERVHPDDRQRHRTETLGCLKEDHFSEGTYRFYNANTGEYRWYHVEASLVGQSDGAELAYFQYTDVDDLKKAEGDLQRGRQQYELAVKGAHLAVWEYDIPARRLTLPEGESSVFTRQHYGFEGSIVENVPESLLPMGVSDDDRANLLKLYDQIRTGEEYATTDVWFRKSADEEPCCDRITYYVVKDDAGIPTLAYGVGADITAQKQEELGFHQAIQTILTANPEALCTFRIDLSRDLCYEGHGVSPFVLRSLQSETATGLFSRCLGIIPFPEDAAKVSSVLNREKLLEGFAVGRDSVHVDYRRLGENGSILWVRTFVNLLKNPGIGDVEGVIYSLDISREKRLSDIFDILTGEEFDLIAVLDLASHKVEVTHLSPMLPAAYNRSFMKVGDICDLDQMRENGADSWVAQDERQKYLEGTDVKRIKQMLDRDGRYELTVKGQLPGRGVVYRKLQHYYLNDEKNAVLIIDSDVTQMYLQQQRELAEEKALRMQAAAANEAKSEFLSRMSHDMRTPLNGILGMVYLTESLDLPQQARENLMKIDTSSKFLLSLINDVLDMAKAESANTELHFEPYAPAEFEEYLEAVVKPLCAEKSQTLSVKVDISSERIPLFDKLRINQVVFNLLSNAVKYTPEGGHISYHAHFGDAGEDGRTPVRIEVSDDGIGMSEEFQRVLFEPFTQEGRVDASESRGTGLGLAIVKRLVDLMGGTIQVKSVAGKGTTFTVNLVVDSVLAEDIARTDARADDRDESALLAGMHVLLCEDHPLNQEIAKAILAQKGVLVELAENGQRGVELFNKSAIGFFDAILMDIRMPVMDGFEAARRIRALDRRDASTVPIIAMTADAFADDVRKCLDAGMNAHIAKPIEPQLLFDELIKVRG